MYKGTDKALSVLTTPIFNKNSMIDEASAYALMQGGTAGKSRPSEYLYSEVFYFNKDAFFINKQVKKGQLYEQISHTSL